MMASYTSNIVPFELPPWAIYGSIALASILVLLKATGLLGSSRRGKLPPGPRPWPIIGNLNLISHLPHRSIHELAKKYGPFMTLKLGSNTVIVASSVDAVRLFLKTHDLNFASRPKTAAGKYTTYNHTDITWSPYGAYWRQARKMCVMELFSTKRIDSFEYIRVEELKRLYADLFRSSGKTIVIREELSTLSLNVICRMVLGKKYLDETNKTVVTPDEFKEMVEELFLLNGVLNIGDSIPWLNFLDLQGYIKRMKVLSKKFDRFLEHVVDEHNERRKAEGAKFVAKDMVDVLLQQVEDPGLDVKISRQGVKAFTQDLLAGGTESTTITVEWAITELLRNPENFEKATRELDQVVGKDRWVDEADIPNLPFIQAIVKETMRMHPVAPLLPPRIAREDCDVNGYHIPKGTQVLINMWTIERDPTIWGDPEAFRPDRFLTKDVNIMGTEYELLPFGAGRRMCPGYSLGVKVIDATLANLLHGFDWKLPKGMLKENLGMEEIHGLSTPRKVPVEVVAEPRLPSHLYGV